eukprot:Awhi_evm1s5001
MSNRNEQLEPYRRPLLEFDGNSCHSNGFFWSSAGCIYVGGHLRHDSSQGDLLVYSPGRSHTRKWGEDDLVFSNTKVFLANSGINHWGFHSEIVAFEAHDTNRAIQVLGIHYIHDLLITCRTGSNVPEEPRNLYEPVNNRYRDKNFQRGYVGFQWYDVDQRHIVKDIIFRKCGDAATQSAIWETLTHSDEFVPQMMQMTDNVTYEDCDEQWTARPNVDKDTVANRLSGWIDNDGSIKSSRIGVPTVVGSATATAGDWWKIDDTCETIAGHFWFCDLFSPTDGSIERNVASFQFFFSNAVHDEVGKTVCPNGGGLLPCDTIGYVQHFEESRQLENGVALTANPRTTGPMTGAPWYLKIDKGSPKNGLFDKIQMGKQDTLIVALPYPKTALFQITYTAAT